MTHPELDLTTARAALEAAVQQLVQPVLVPIDRDGPEHPDVAEVEREAERAHQAASARLRSDHAAALHRRDAAGMRRALARLVQLEHQHRARAGDRTAARGWTPSLLDQLRDAVESSTSSGGAASAGAHRSPIGLAAAELLSQIARTVGARPGGDLTARLRSWASLAGHWLTEQPDTLLAHAELTRQWADTAHAVLHPQRRLTAVGACPHCARTTCHVRDDTGDVVRRPALELDPGTGSARCIAPGCGAYWPPEHVHLLASVLEEQRAQQDDTRRAG